MIIPPEFRTFSIHFHQDMHIVHKTLDQVIDAGLHSLDREQLLRLTPFIDDLASGRRPTAELEQVWNDSEADWFVRDNRQLLPFFRRVRERLALRLAALL